MSNKVFIAKVRSFFERTQYFIFLLSIEFCDFVFTFLLCKLDLIFLILNFRRVLIVVSFHLGKFPAFRNSLSVPSSKAMVEHQLWKGFRLYIYRIGLGRKFNIFFIFQCFLFLAHALQRCNSFLYYSLMMLRQELNMQLILTQQIYSCVLYRFTNKLITRCYLGYRRNVFTVIQIITYTDIVTWRMFEPEAETT